MRAIAILAVVVASGCAGMTPMGDARPHGWLAGVALDGRPVCPEPTGQTLHCRHGPLPRAAVVVSGEGHERRLRADREGRFRLALAPGRYVVYQPGAALRMVRVLAGRVTQVTLPGWS